MPRLSTYVDDSGTAAAGLQQPQQPGGGGDAATAPLATAQQQCAVPAAAPQGALPSQPAPQLDPQHEAAAAKLQADYAKRLREHGPRAFRWPDGSLRPERPPPNPHAVANRKLWAPLVQHCRTHGGDGAYERTGASLRHGLGVPHEQHAAFLARIRLAPETTAAGEFVGEAPGLAPPLEDPQHAFHTYFKEGAEAVFKDKLGRLL